MACLLVPLLLVFRNPIPDKPHPQSEIGIRALPWCSPLVGGTRGTQRLDECSSQNCVRGRLLDCGGPAVLGKRCAIAVRNNTNSSSQLYCSKLTVGRFLMQFENKKPASLKRNLDVAARPSTCTASLRFGSHGRGGLVPPGGFPRLPNEVLLHVRPHLSGSQG